MLHRDKIYKVRKQYHPTRWSSNRLDPFSRLLRSERGNGKVRLYSSIYGDCPIQFKWSNLPLCKKSSCRILPLWFRILHFIIFCNFIFHNTFYIQKNKFANIPWTLRRKINGKQRSHEWIGLTINSITPSFIALNKAGIWKQWTSCITL